MIFTFIKFHQYVYSKNVIVELDHEPLGNSEEISLPYHQDYKECCYNYKSSHFTLQYKAGKEMTLADTLSCAYMFPRKHPLKIFLV